jgi:hypothetical protein
MQQQDQRWPLCNQTDGRRESVKEGKVRYSRAMKNFLMDSDPDGKLMNAAEKGTQVTGDMLQFRASTVS